MNASIFDVAKYILDQAGSMTTMKLQKLCYYSQAWSLVWDERPLFPEPFEAWANGPVCRTLYADHRGLFTVGADSAPSRISQGDPSKLDEAARETVDAVIRDYGVKSAQWLSDLTHAEDPWRNARAGLSLGDNCANPITDGAMADYYGGLHP